MVTFKNVFWNIMLGVLDYERSEMRLEKLKHSCIRVAR